MKNLATPKSGSESELGVRARRSAERRAAIMDAALDLFAERGFAATRMEDVAARARVAKGTLYLHFADKQALFEGIVRLAVGPRIAALSQIDVRAIVSVRDVIEVMALPSIAELTASRYAAIPRLLIAEGARFPRLAEFYHAEIIQPGKAVMRRLMARAIETGEIAGDALTHFPQLLVAPVLMGVVWQGLFQALEPLDIESMLKAWLDLVFVGPPRADPPPIARRPRE